MIVIRCFSVETEFEPVKLGQEVIKLGVEIFRKQVAAVNKKILSLIQGRGTVSFIGLP